MKGALVPLAIILTKACRAAVSMMIKGVLWPKSFVSK